MIIVGAGHDNGVNDPLVLAASILATAINGAQRQQQQVSQVKNIYKNHLNFPIHKKIIFSYNYQPEGLMLKLIIFTESNTWSLTYNVYRFS